jgi:N-acetylglucosamine-6-phosphate deacetylase
MAGVTIHKGDGVVVDDRGSLAGSALTLDEGVRMWMDATGQSLAAAVDAASERPARLVGIRAGLYEGNPANLSIMDEKGFVQAAMSNGQWVTSPA